MILNIPPISIASNLVGGSPVGFIISMWGFKKNNNMNTIATKRLKTLIKGIILNNLFMFIKIILITAKLITK